MFPRITGSVTRASTDRTSSLRQAQPVDLFDDSVSHSANVRAGTRPGQPGLPVGLGVGAGYYQEDISNLDQRVRDAYVRGDVTVPVTPTLAVVCGAGIEDVEVSSRDACAMPTAIRLSATMAASSPTKAVRAPSPTKRAG